MKKRGFGTNFHNVYDSDAETYHSFSKIEHFSRKLSIKIHSFLTSGTLLDIGAGTCHKTNLFSNSFDTVYALDYSKSQLEFARSKYNLNKKLHFLWASATDIPLLDESVDSIIITWGSFPLSEGIKEMMRVLKKGGFIVRIGVVAEDDFTKLFPAFDIGRVNRINQTFKKYGFTIERHKVAIRFRNLAEAKRVLTKITGTDALKIKRTNFEHEVALCYYRKQ